MKKRKNIKVTWLIALITVSSLLFTGCNIPFSKPTQAQNKTGLYFDTVITVTLYGSREETAPLLKGCFQLADRFEKRFSNTRSTSEISRINEAAGKPVSVSSDTVNILKDAISYGQKSNGAFDVTIGRLSDAWDFKSNTGHIPSQNTLQQAVKTIDYTNIQISDDTVSLCNPNARLDLGGIAKGYIADSMKTYLKKQGVTKGIINLGGNVLCIGEKEKNVPFTVGIQKPFTEDGTPLFTLKIKDLSVVTSGTYQRYFRKNGKLYHHILNTKTGLPVQNHLTSVTIISNRSTDGDALSTTAFCMGAKDGLAYIEKLKNTEAIFVLDSGNILKTSGIGTKIPFTLVK